MNEDKELKERIGKDNPFKVPEGYFENLTSDIMNNIPDDSGQANTSLPLWSRVKPWFYMAAMFCGILFSARIFIHKSATDTIPAPDMSAAYEEEFLPNSLIDPIGNQTMMDDYSLYVYINSNTEEE